LKVRVLISILFLVSFSSLYGQAEYPAGQPLFPEITEWHEVNVDPLEAEIMRSIDQPKDQPYRFAIPVPVELTPRNAGFITESNGETVWVMPVSSKGALSLNLILSPFRLPEGAYIYIYDGDKRIVRGAYTCESGTDNNTLPLMPLPGDRMVLECHFPGKTIPAGAIGIKQVAHDFAGFFTLEGIKDLYYGRSEGCEVDLNCSTNASYLLAARSTVRLLIAGAELCTGVLVNNTGSDYKAYILTANHCIDSPDLANNTIFVFNYISPWCDGPDLTNMHSLSGSLLRAANPDIDFTLVELNQFPSLVYRPYFAGWDITGSVPSNTFTLHHPEGDVMKISIDNNAPITASYPSDDATYISNGFWRVLRWEMGATEPGSSGAPLFDTHGRVRGTLTGGGANCLNPANDYYAKIIKMFNITTITSTHLQPWLDPGLTGATVVSGRDPYEYNLSRSDTLGNMPVSDPGASDSYTSPGWGYSTGHNSDSLIRYAEYIPFSGTGEIAWIRMNIASASYLSASDSIRIYVWSGVSQPGSVIASRMFRLREAKDNFEFVVDFGKTIKVTGSFYVGYTIYYRNSLSYPQSQFAVEHSFPWPLPSQNTAWFHDGDSWKPFTQHPSFPMAASLGINVIMVENTILNDIENTPEDAADITVFPNPFNNSLSFSKTDSTVKETSLRIYDNTGRVVSSGEYRNIFPGVLTIDLPELLPGIYHYRLRNDSVYHTGTIIKIESM
jgi:lysyl endopeptidase